MAAALQSFFAVHVTNFKEAIFGHNFVRKHHNLAYFWLKIKKAKFFLISFFAAHSTNFFLLIWPAGKKV